MKLRLPAVAFILAACGGAVNAVAPIVDDEDKPDAGSSRDAGSRTDSSLGSADVNSTVAPPTFSPPPGTFLYAQNVTLTASTGAEILFSLDGSEPKTKYTGPIALLNTTTLRAVAVVAGKSSVVVTGDYVIYRKEAHEFVTASHDPGQYENTIAVALSSRASTICYTLDSTAPHCAGDGGCSEAATYAGPIPLSPQNDAGASRLRTVACAANGIPTDVVDFTYTFKVGAITGTGGPDFNLQSPTLDETIRYGSADVTCTQTCPNDTTCTECTPGDAGCQTGTVDAAIKAVGCKSGFMPSATATFTP